MIRFANRFLTASLLFLTVTMANAQTSCSYIVHVTTSGTDVPACGGEGTPCQTISYGINEALAQGLSDVRVSNGIYNEVVVLRTGVNVWGGYDAAWNQVNTTTLNGIYDVVLDQYLAVSGNGALGGVILSDFTINAPNATTSGKSSYGIHLLNSSVIVQNCFINGGFGATGTAGINGVDGTGIAANGTNGENGGDTGLCSTVIANGGTAGAGTVTTGGGAGGNGGASDVACPFGSYTAQDGVFGDNAQTYNWLTWGYAGANGQECVDGTDGNDGVTLYGVGGTGAATPNTLVSNFWVSTVAANGTTSLDGTGGGGGGGGGGCDTGSNGNGGGGGGGGAGGLMATTGGTGGRSGGNSVCIFSMSSNITMINTSMDIGAGGNGGNGGTSGVGAPGGNGGNGGNGGTTSGAGGDGGDGAAGGDSGSGGGGAGGSAYGLYINSSIALSNSVTYISGAAGNGGSAGTSANAPGTGGSNGQTQNVKNVSSSDNTTSLVASTGICTEIITLNLTTTSFCAGEAFTVDYTAVGDFTVGNIFSVQLSDGLGSFAIPTVIGTLASITSGTIPVVIPGGTLPGTGYKIRVISSLQAATGTESVSTITINAVPFVTYTVSGTTPVCLGGSITLTGIGTDSYTWTNGVTNGQSFNPTMTLEYIVTGTSTASGCSSTDTVTIVVNPTSSTTLIVESCGDYLSAQGNTYATTGMYDEIYSNSFGCDSTVTIDLTVTILDVTVTTSNSVYTANGTGTYQWLDCTTGYSIIAGETGQTFSPTANGDYAVEITNGTCVDTSACKPIFNVGIIELPNALTDNVYPNPTTGMITISMKDFTEQLTIEVRDITGKLISTNLYSQTNSVEMNIEGTEGVYFIHLTSEDGKNQVVKVVKRN